VSDGLCLPAPDACAYCGAGQAAHTSWQNGGPSHDFRSPEPGPRPDRIASAHIQTDWTCTHCGAECDVWGVAEAWMECGVCGKQSYLVPFANVVPEPDVSEEVYHA